MTDKRIVNACDPILVTGANGFIGTSVVEVLLEYGYSNLRCFVRPSSRLEQLERVIAEHNAKAKVELVVGDLLCASGGRCRRRLSPGRGVRQIVCGRLHEFCACDA